MSFIFRLKLENYWVVQFFCPNVKSEKDTNRNCHQIQPESAAKLLLLSDGSRLKLDRFLTSSKMKRTTLIKPTETETKLGKKQMIFLLESCVDTRDREVTSFDCCQ